MRLATLEATATSPPTATNTAEPTATSPPTSTATQEPTATSQPTETETAEPTATSPPTATRTEEATVTTQPTAPPPSTDTAEPAVTSTLTPLPSLTATATVEPTLTRILPITETPTPTPTPAPIQPQPPSLPQLAEEDIPTATSEADVIVPRATIPTPLIPPTADETEIAELLATPPPRPTEPVTWTPAPTVPRGEVVFGPATATTPDDPPTQDSGFVFNPTPSDATPPAEVGVLDLPPTPTTVVLQPTVAVRPEFLPPTLSPISFAQTFSASGVTAYQYSVGPGQNFTFQNIQLRDGVRLFLPNPVDGNSWIRTDHYGILRYKPIGVAQEGVMTVSPFFAGFSATSFEENKNRIVELDWSADGQQFSFRIDPSRDPQSHNDMGVWFWQPEVGPLNTQNYMLIRDCPAEGYGSCNLVQRTGPPWYWKTRGVEWSPIPGSNSVLARVRLPDEGRNALAIVQARRDPNYAQRQPNFVRYDYGYWNPNGQGIIVSGRRPDGRVIIGEVNNDLSGERIILDASALGLWVRDAVRRPNGQVIALGRPGGPGSGPVALYDSSGTQLTGFIGDAAPEDVRWYPNRSLVVVSVQGRQYTVQVAGGSIVDATDRLGNPQFSASGFGSSTIPSGVVQGSEFAPGQQLRMLRDLNIRQEASTSSPVVGALDPGDYVAVLAGPHRESRYEWWRIQTANNIVGWIAAKIDGQPTVQRL
ncbi:MAG: SH3 domain-containing protein [Chloroflexi bacterium]|nr:SH3 domain-containing protein [Chloroflexota bacterium]